MYMNKIRCYNSILYGSYMFQHHMMHKIRVTSQRYHWKPISNICTLYINALSNRVDLLINCVFTQVWCMEQITSKRRWDIGVDRYHGVTIHTSRIEMFHMLYWMYQILVWQTVRARIHMYAQRKFDIEHTSVGLAHAHTIIRSRLVNCSKGTINGMLLVSATETSLCANWENTAPK